MSRQRAAMASALLCPSVECSASAVEVRQRHGVVVDERQLAHARAHQRLDRVAAHAAETEHGDVAAAQSVHAVRAEHHFGA